MLQIELIQSDLFKKTGLDKEYGKIMAEQAQ